MSAKINVDERAIRTVVEEVLAKLAKPGAASAERPAPAAVGRSCECRRGPSKGDDGVFTDADKAAAAARGAFEQLREKGLETRARIVEIVKEACSANAREWGKLEFDETRIGRLDHKVEKLQSIKGIPGVEWLRPMGYSGDRGIALEEQAPWGVIGVVTPVTHSIPTIASNIVNMVAAGNALVVNPHPGGAKCAAEAMRAINRAIRSETGIENLVAIVETPTLETFGAICKSGDVDILCVTGGPGVVRAAMASGKRAICAGPGNPPVLVDGTADLGKAARDIVYGGGYDNNLLCIGEKQVFVTRDVYEPFLEAMEAAWAVRLSSSEIEALAKEAFVVEKAGGGRSKASVNRELVGADASVLAERAGRRVPSGTEVLFGETGPDHLFVEEEQMMPFIPIVRVPDVEAGIAAAVKSEHGYGHSSMIHSQNVSNMTAMGRAADTTLFVKNGSCLAGMGLGGEGYASYSIATATGEGITTPATFTRFRRCVMVGSLSIV